MTKKEFNILMAVSVPILTVVVLVLFIFVTNKQNEQKKYYEVTDEARAELETWKKVANTTKKKVSENLWNTAENEALLLSSTIEADTVMSVYANYFTESGTYNTIVASGTMNGLDTKIARDTAKLKFNNKIASTSVVDYYGEDNVEVCGVIINWTPKTGGNDVYSLIDINGDGSWDYISKGKEGALFDDTSGNITYTDDFGNEFYANAEVYAEVVSPHVTLSEAEKLLD